jgi:hypothetical protein
MRRRRGDVGQGRRPNGGGSAAAAAVGYVSVVIAARSSHLAMRGGDVTPSPSELSGRRAWQFRGARSRPRRPFSMFHHRSAKLSPRTRGCFSGRDSPGLGGRPRAEFHSP